MFGTYFPTFFLLSRSAFPSMCARRLFAARPPFANSAVLSPLRASSPRLRTTRTRTWGAPARVTGAAPAAAEKTGTTLRVERRGTSATPGEDRPTAAQDDRRAWRQAPEWAAEVRLYNKTGRGGMSRQCRIRRNGTWPTPSTTPSTKASVPLILTSTRRSTRTRPPIQTRPSGPAAWQVMSAQRSAIGCAPAKYADLAVRRLYESGPDVVSSTPSWT